MSQNKLIVPDGFRADDYFVEFDSAPHAYYINGRAVPSVTQIIADGGYASIAMTPNERAARGRALGKEAHRVIARMESEKAVDVGSLDPEVTGFVRAYERFVQSCRYVPLLIERIVYHPAYGYAGTFDTLAAVNAVVALADFKTGATGRQDWMGWQLAAYQRCIPKSLIERELGRAGMTGLSTKVHRKVIRLLPDGTFRLIDFRDQFDFDRFLKLVGKRRGA